MIQLVILIARNDDFRIMTGSDRGLTFGGFTSNVIPAGALVVSDPVDLNVPALGNLAVSVFVPGNRRRQLGTSRRAKPSTSLLPEISPRTLSCQVDAPAPAIPAWFWLAGVDVIASKQTGAIVTFGDSITHGTNSKQDANNR